MSTFWIQQALTALSAGAIGGIFSIACKQWLTTPYPNLIKIEKRTITTTAKRYRFYARIRVDCRYGPKIAKNARCRVILLRDGLEVHNAHSIWADITEVSVEKQQYRNLSQMDISGEASIALFEFNKVGLDKDGYRCDEEGEYSNNNNKPRLRFFSAAIPCSYDSSTDKLIDGEDSPTIREVCNGEENYKLKILFASENSTSKEWTISLKHLLKELESKNEVEVKKRFIAINNRGLG